MEAKLRTAFAPTHLEVIDESEKHRGHAGYREGGQTHFQVVIRAAAFNGQSRVARSRMIHKVLAEDLAEQVHALALKVEGTED
ncbi:BolA family transcriptional regulator [Halovulum dunhuangense]|uniref:BolA family transcriptional regulator n=2 Tax=Halovulum dunhuangense TaxID=1505036 RepID=A0A849L189_9RHOB|nr:BolA family protein [Halovulum dunhuangense]NNU80030.1 BolA family transcriptional regulator [Halovulum dunhuangense]